MAWMHRAARTAQMIMGALLVLSGVLKVWEPVLFYWELVPYAQLLGVTQHWEMFAQAGLLVAPFECFLGVALLANWRPGLVMPLAVALMAFFIGLMVWAWHLGATEECGCFGALVKRSPGEAAVEDVVMLALLLFGWWGAWKASAWRFAGGLVAGGTALALLVGVARFVPNMERLEHSDLLPGVRLSGLEIQGVSVDITQGRYLIELFSPRCSRCLQSVPKLNRVDAATDLPPVIGLASFARESAAMVDFITASAPRYPIGTISKTDYFRLTWRHGFPRLAYVVDGVVRRVWEYNEFPTAEALRALAESSEPAERDSRVP